MVDESRFTRAWHAMLNSWTGSLLRWTPKLGEGSQSIHNTTDIKVLLAALQWVEKIDLNFNEWRLVGDSRFACTNKKMSKPECHPLMAGWGQGTLYKYPWINLSCSERIVGVNLGTLWNSEFCQHYTMHVTPLSSLIDLVVHLLSVSCTILFSITVSVSSNYEVLKETRIQRCPEVKLTKTQMMGECDVV